MATARGTAKAPARASKSPAKAPAKSKSPIHIKASTKGTYTARAKAQGHTVQQQARIDLAPSSKATAAVKAKANFARNAKAWNH